MERQLTKPRVHRGAGKALALLLTINLFNYIDRQVLAAVEPPLSAEFKLTEAGAGLLASAFLYAYMFGAPILGRLAERVSRWWVVAGSVAVWSLASGWTGMAGSFGVLLASRVIVGIGEAGYGPAAPALISDYFPIERRATVMAMFYMAIPVGSALGYIIGGQVNEWLGWRWAFLLVVPPGLALAGLALFMREPQPHAPRVPRKHALRADTMALLRIPSYLLNTAAMTAMTFAIGGISFWIPKYMTLRVAEQQGLPLLTALGQVAALDQFNKLLTEVNTTFGTIVVIAGLLATFSGGWLGDRLRPRLPGAYFLISGVAILLAFPCTLAMIYLPFPYAWFAVFGAVFFLFFNTGPANTALANVTAPNMRATAFAMNIFFIHALGDAISPPFIGWVKERTSWNTAFMLVSLMTVLASALWFIGARYLGADTEAVLRIEEQREIELPPR
jgi:MFS transporter, Spinster family, sphingosine-1-phosphate transporter